MLEDIYKRGVRLSDCIHIIAEKRKKGREPRRSWVTGEPRVPRAILTKAADRRAWEELRAEAIDGFMIGIGFDRKRLVVIQREQWPSLDREGENLKAESGRCFKAVRIIPASDLSKEEEEALTSPPEDQDKPLSGRERRSLHLLIAYLAGKAGYSPDRDTVGKLKAALYRKNVNMDEKTIRKHLNAAFETWKEPRE